ncbi:MAG: YihY/virulence factor BrkB family protein [Vicinamibacterales bacterium]
MIRTAFRLPISYTDLARRTASEVVADNCLGLAAQLAYYFFLALFPALLVLVALLSFVPVDSLMETVMGTLSRVAPPDVLQIIRDQLETITSEDGTGLLTFGMLGALWSSSSGITAVMDSLNQAYDIRESRPWWKVRLTAVVLTVALALFIIVSTVLVVGGPALAEQVAEWFYLGDAFAWTWKILQWPVVFLLVSMAMALIYYYAPDAEQEWTWITPGSIAATLLWLIVSLGFRFYVTSFGNYNATYGAIGGVIVLLLWFYLSALAVLVGAELNAEIEHASPYGKDPGERKPGERKRIGSLAARVWEQRKQAGTLAPAWAGANCLVDAELPQAVPARWAPPRASDWLRSAIVVGEAALLTYAKLRARLRKVKS